MIYRSNLGAPELAQHFDLRDPALQTCGHDMPSDRVFDPNCGFWTHDEAAILYTIARSRPGWWIDIGSRMGWTSAHLIAAGCHVVGVDPGYKNTTFLDRALLSVRAVIGKEMSTGFYPYNCQSERFFREARGSYDGFVIDGDHDSPVPFDDAIGAMTFAKPDAVVLFHDFWGRPIQEAVERMMQFGWLCRVFYTPNGVAACWRGSVTIPRHIPDPAIDWKEFARGRAPEFDFSRCV